MSAHTLLRCSAAALLPILWAGAASAASDHDGAPRVFGNDLFFTGSQVSLAADVLGDALLAGARVTVDRSIGGDAVAAGREVRMRGSIDEDLYAAGANVLVSGMVTGSARIAGGEVEIARSASIADGASIFGGEVNIDGRIGPYAQIAGGTIRIDGYIDGDVEVSGGELSIGPNAAIQGAVTFRGPEPARVSPNARIRDGVRNIQQGGDRSILAFFGVLALVWLAGWLIVGILLLALVPNATRSVTEAVRARPGRALLLGILLLFVVPIAIGLSAATVIGIPLALLLLLAYFVLLPIGYLASIATVGDSLLMRLRPGKPVTTAARIGMFAAALIVLYLLTLVPVIGGIIAVLLVVLGMGGILLAISRGRAVVPPSADQPG